MDGAPNLEIVDVRKVYRASVAFDGVRFAFQPGGLRAPASRSGAGKSTPGKFIAGALQTASGHVRAATAFRHGATWKGRQQPDAVTPRQVFGFCVVPAPLMKRGLHA